MNVNQTAFLLDLLISKVVGNFGLNDPSDFILHYRLDESTAEAVVNEVITIGAEVKNGIQVTDTIALDRVGRFHGPGMGSPSQFVSSAFKVWSPETWSIINGLT